MDPEPADDDTTTEAYPWEVGHASPEDRAMGLELELIELEHTREVAEDHGDPVAPIEDEISEVIEELIDVVPDEGPEHGAEIAAPEAIEIVDVVPDLRS